MHSKLHRRRFIGITAAAAGVAALPAVAGTDGLHVWTGTALGARASLRLYHPDSRTAEAAIQRCIAEIGRLERIFSLYRPDSAVSTLNREGAIHSPPFDLVRLLDSARHLHRTTGGIFDMTVQPLWQLHAAHFSQQPVPVDGPAGSALAAALALVGQEAVLVEPDRIAFARPGMALTPNGIAQGYVTDRIAELLRSEGFADVLVDLGEARASGEHPDGTPWRAALADPAGGAPLRKVDLDGALATSAPSGFAFDRAGRFHHIFDPRTGQPAEARPSVSVLAPEATVADALSTAFVQMSTDDIRRTLRVHAGVTVHALTRDGLSEELSSAAG
ncbi:FAD:protein FMN transferase [Citreimonas salinaria]|uniref:FAD:protein FMN transferase n=1 Tax=Citreimonas salinaria TaxID=321339 RepID=A0A1H3P0Y3_9RHOB|nr:FAD:protein FMN transferase [Citreimonas salinaria]SDY94777.1 thiamine biosynthesis lipoprotein [Citreimonas salinaria]